MFGALRNLKEKHELYARKLHDEAGPAMNEALRQFLHEYRAIDAIVAKRIATGRIYISVHIAGGEWLTSNTVVESGLKTAMVDIENSLTAIKDYLPTVTTHSFIGQHRDKPSPYIIG